MSQAHQFNVTLTNVDPDVGKLLQTMAEQLNGLAACVQLLSATCGMQQQVMEHMAGLGDRKDPIKFGQVIVEAIDKVIEHNGPHYLLDHMRSCWNSQPKLTVVKK